MRRIYGSAIVLMLLLLLGVAAAGSGSSAGLLAQQASISGGNTAATATTAVPDSTRKLPPPADSIKPAPPSANNQPSACTAPVVNVSAQSGNEDESYVVVNPTNTNNIVAFSNLGAGNSIFRAYTMNGGTTWTRGTVATNVACCDGQAAFDSFGNLFLVYINGSVNQINVILSTDGGATFSAPVLAGTGGVDQPSIAVGNGSVWVDWNLGGAMQARGAPVTGLGTWGPFNAVQVVPGATGSFGGIAVGPGPNGGKVMVTYQNPTGGQGPATIFVNVDADGLGAGNFGPQITATTTNVGGFDFIPAQSARSIDAEAGLVWDSTAGPFNNRVYLIYTEETVNENNDTEIYVRTSTNDGTTWSAPVRVNDDPVGSPIRSQFLPYITLDRSTGTVAAGWQDARNDNGVPGSGGTNNIPNDDAEYYASYSTNGGVTWAANQRLSSGFSNAAAAAAPVDYGDYEGQDAAGGKFVAVWADNANCDNTNPNGTLHAFDLYMGTMTLPAQGTPTPTATGTPPTATQTRTPTQTPTATATTNPCLIANYIIATGTATIVPGTVNTGSACDDCDTAITLPFPFTLYGQSFTTVNASSNGHLDFATINEPGGYSNTCLPAAPNVGPYDYTIFAHWDDLRTDQAGNGIFTSVSGSAPNRIFNIEWRANYFSGTGTANFEVRLYEGLTRFDLVYGTLSGGGTSATTGVQGPTPRFTQYSCNTALTSGLLLTFDVPPCGTPTVGPSPTNTVLSTATQTATTGASPTNTAPPTGTAPPTSAATSTATVTPQPTACAISFNDVPVGSTFYDYIRCLACRGIVGGYPCGGPGEPCPGNYYRPNNNVTRGQVSKIVSESAGFNDAVPSTQQTFEDVPPGSTFALWVERLSVRGIIGGYPCGGPFEPCVSPTNRPYFRPNNNVTRGQLSKITSGAAGWTETPTGQTFEDVAVGSTFYVYIERMASRGIISGYPCGGPFEPCVAPANRPYFRPNNNATRGQMAKIAASAFFPNCATPARH